MKDKKMKLKKESYNVENPIFLIEDYDNEDSRFTLTENIESFKKQKVDSYINDISYYMNDNEDWTFVFNDDILDNLMYLSCPPKQRQTTWKYKKNKATFYNVYRIDPESVKDFLDTDELEIDDIDEIDADALFGFLNSNEKVLYELIDVAELLYKSFSKDIKEELTKLATE